MTNQTPIKKFDLEERTAKFAESVLKFAKKIPQNTINTPLVSQLVRSATSIGANYSEADDAESRMDFVHKIGICKKEARETKYWLRMLTVVVPELKVEIKTHWQEAKELNLIFNAIVRSARLKN